MYLNKPEKILDPEEGAVTLCCGSKIKIKKQKNRRGEENGKHDEEFGKWTRSRKKTP